MASEHTPVKFKDAVPGLPSRTPEDHAHVIDLSTFDAAKSPDIKLWDAIVTIIFRESSPQDDLLNRFLHFSQPRAGLSFEYRINNGLPLYTNMIMMRHGREVIVGKYLTTSEVDPVNRLFDPETKNKYHWTICTTPMIDDLECSGGFVAKGARGRADMGRALGVWLLSNIPNDRSNIRTTKYGRTTQYEVSAAT